MRVEGLDWSDPPGGLPWRETKTPGISWLPLWLEADEPVAGSQKGGATVLIRMEPGCGYAAHRHLGSEDVLVLAGGYSDEFGSYSKGEHVHYGPDSAHHPVALGEKMAPIGPSNPACVLYSCVPCGIELL